MFGSHYNPVHREEPETLPAILAVPKVEEDRLFFCKKCGCNYINLCPNHSEKKEK
jgi:hypothetical protein